MDFSDARLGIARYYEEPNMKTFFCVIQCVMLAFSAQAWASTDDQNCASRSKQLTAPEQKKFLESCLAHASSPEHVRAATEQKKRNHCEQNARNMKLEGGKKSDYINDCMNKNVAASEANKVNAKSPALAKSEHAANTRTANASKPAHQAHPAARAKPTPQPKAASGKKTCGARAKQQGLKGEERKKFMRDCRKA